MPNITTPFARYILARFDTLPTIDPASLFEFIIAGNGVFVRARRAGLEAMIPVSACEIRGLLPVEAYVRLAGSKVPLACMQTILAEFQRDLPNESLVWIKLEDGLWKVLKPRQTADGYSVHPIDPFDPDGAEALLDVHSHNTMEPFFSTDDDRDETGFRIFTVLGRLNDRPCVMARIGIYGYYWHLNAGAVFELPEGIEDALALKHEQAALCAAEMEVNNDEVTANCP